MAKPGIGAKVKISVGFWADGVGGGGTGPKSVKKLFLKDNWEKSERLGLGANKFCPPPGCALDKV